MPGSWTGEGTVVTRDLSNAILPGVTRRIILEAAADAQLQVVERKFTVAEALAAREAFLSSATGAAVPVVAIDGQNDRRRHARDRSPAASMSLYRPGRSQGRRIKTLDFGDFLSFAIAAIRYTGGQGAA